MAAPRWQVDIQTVRRQVIRMSIVCSIADLLLELDLTRQIDERQMQPALALMV